ncbi:MAG TPA: glycosyltransferase [Terriglobia bacterium]|nr:glycosyltransferase [Terriglobia bacterium]
MNTGVSSASGAPDIVYLGAEHLEKGVFSRSQAIAWQLARWSRVLYANVDFCSVFHYSFDRLFRRDIEHAVGLHAVDQNLWALDCLTPVPYALMRKFNRLNLWAATPQLRRAIPRLKFKDYVLWLGSPLMTPMVDHFPASTVCYDYMDDFPGFFQGRARRIASELEKRLLERCDFVIATSEALSQKARRLNPNVHLVRNGVAPGHYDGKPLLDPPELRSLPRPVLGYIGSVGPWFDLNLFAELAGRYAHGSLVVVGGLSQIAAPELSKLPNVHFLGWKPHRELPQYLGAFDVCLIPFLINDLTFAVNPIKFYEHCAAGKPTVSMRLPELEPYRDICYLADSPEEFISAADRALRESDQPERAAELGRRRRRVAEENSWEARGRQLQAILSSRNDSADARLHAGTALALD